MVTGCFFNEQLVDRIEQQHFTSSFSNSK